MRVVKIIFFSALAILFNYSESMPPPNWNNIPEPASGILPSRFYYSDGSIHELNRPNALPFVVGGYFLGMQDSRQFLFPIFNNDPNRVYSFSQQRLVDITSDERSRLVAGRPLSVRRRGRQPHLPQVQASTSGQYPAGAFSGLPSSRYYYDHGTLREYGHLSARPFIVHNFFLGMVDNTDILHPVDPANPLHVYSLISRSMTMISPETRHILLNEP